MRENLSETFLEIRKDFDEIDEDEYSDMITDTINEGIYHPVFIAITDIMMCFEKYMMETTHLFPFMSEAEREEVLIKAVKDHLVPSSS